MIFTDATELLSCIVSDLKRLDVRNGFIGIDGNDGSGKSTLASYLAGNIFAKHLELDIYIKRHEENYTKSLRIQEIQDKIGNERDRITIVDGVCLLDAAEKCGLKFNILVYMKKYNTRGEWLDTDECDEDSKPEETIKEITEKFRLKKLSALREEIIRYHYQYKPIRRADYIFHIIKKDS